MANHLRKFIIRPWWDTPVVPLFEHEGESFILTQPEVAKGGRRLIGVVVAAFSLDRWFPGVQIDAPACYIHREIFDVNDPWFAVIATYDPSEELRRHGR